LIITIELQVLKLPAIYNVAAVVVVTLVLVLGTVLDVHVIPSDDVTMLLPALVAPTNKDNSGLQQTWLIPLIGELADDKLAMKMKDTGSRAQESQIYRALWTKNNLIPYMEHELSNAENSIWWDDDANLHR
jgi:flagellar biosynthesis regulator FlbT